MTLKEVIRFADIDDRTEELRDLADEHPDIWMDFLEKFQLSHLYHENAMEGIVVTHAELTSALRGRPIAPDTYFAIRNLKLAIAEASKAVETRTGAIDLEFVKSIHAVLGSGETDFVAGRYRKIIPLHRTYFHDIAQPEKIAPRMLRLMDWAADNEPTEEEAVSFAARFHHEYMSIFPFSRHTGKVGRLLINYTLMKFGYMPVIFHATERQRYYDTLRHAPRDMELFLNEMMVNCIENASKFIQHELLEREKLAQRSAAV